MNSRSEHRAGQRATEHCIDCNHGQLVWGGKCYCLCHRPHPSGVPPRYTQGIYDAPCARSASGGGGLTGSPFLVGAGMPGLLGRVLA